MQAYSCLYFALFTVDYSMWEKSYSPVYVSLWTKKVFTIRYESLPFWLKLNRQVKAVSPIENVVRTISPFALDSIAGDGVSVLSGAAEISCCQKATHLLYVLRTQCHGILGSVKFRILVLADGKKTNETRLSGYCKLISSFYSQFL